MVKGCDIAIIDSYLASPDFYDEIARIAQVSVFVDDNRRIDFPAGIILNGSIYAKDLGYPDKCDGGNLLGPEYFLLRKPFQAQHDKVINARIESALIIFGATDARNMTGGVLDHLVKTFPGTRMLVVVGPGFQVPIDHLVKKYPAVAFHQNLDARGMLALMIEADIAISACGTTLYELACVGVPTIGIGVAENQALNVKKFTEIGFMKFAGWWNEQNLFTNLLFSMRAMIPHESRATASRIGQALVKGTGCLNAVKRIKEAWFKKKLVFSRATKSHCDLLYKWANDDEVRKNSFNSDQISYDTHVKWFEGKLRSSSSYIFIGFIDSTPVGQVRMEIDGLSGVISYSIDKEWRGNGLGNVFLQELPFLITTHNVKVTRLIGRVKVGNLQSQKAFERAGFQKHDGNGFFEYVKDV